MFMVDEYLNWRYLILRLAILIACLFIANATCADTVNIALPDLTGDYDAGLLPPNDAPSLRFSTFTIPPEVMSIQNMRVVMSGASENGWMICEYDIGGGETVLDTFPVITNMRLFLTAPTLEGGCFWGIVNLPAPTFTDESGSVITCDFAEPLDPDLLLNTTVQAELICYFSPMCDPYIDPLASLTDVHLVLNAQLVTAGRKTWGEIKALYR